MTRRLLVSYLTITAFVLLILEIPLGITFQRSERAQLVSGLESDARTFAGLSQDVLTGSKSGVTLATLQPNTKPVVCFLFAILEISRIVSSPPVYPSPLGYGS